MTLVRSPADLFLGSDINYIEVNPNTIVLVKDPAQALQRNTIINAAVRSQKKIEKDGFCTKANTNPRQKSPFQELLPTPNLATR